MIVLQERTEEQVRIYFERTQDEEIKRMLPTAAKSVKDALRMFEETKSETANSYGRTIFADEEYVGDVWCYGIDLKEEPNAMLSFCIFEKSLWGRGICTEAVAQFVEEAADKFFLKSIGAFVYADNKASVRVLEKNGFVRQEDFWEDGVQSFYFEKKLG